jgi:nucleoside-diphosphate-sugar epimerase
MKVLILGSSGFVGQNLYEDLNLHFEVYGTRRSKVIDYQSCIQFDLDNESTWENVVVLKPDVIINASGYGVVRTEQDLETMYRVNYLLPASFFDYVVERIKSRFIQIGTAFEYDLSFERLTEATPCRPKTHYGISKLMMSQYLLNSNAVDFTILRPFGMFGPYESESKFFPYIITAQNERKPIPLSSGDQIRDYFYVKDLSSFIKELIGKTNLPPKVINIGSNQEKKIKELADVVAECIPCFEEKYWQWGIVKQRSNEAPFFVNSSGLAKSLGLKITDYRSAFIQTIEYYVNGCSTTTEI